MKFLPLLCLTAFLAAGTSCIKNARQPRGAKGKTQPNPLAIPAQAQGPKEKLSYTSIPVPGPFIAMTFDDGPVAKNTPRLLDMLAARGIKATFFTVGQNVQMYPNIIRRMAAEGHEVANHTWTHPWITRLSDEAVRLELRRSHDLLTNLTGTAPVMYRPPYGAISTRHEKWILEEFGYPTIIWSVDCADSRPRSTPARVRANVVRETRPGSVILVHDLHSTSVDAMPATLDDLLTKGFKFVTMSQLIAMTTGPKVMPAQAVAAGPTFSPGSF